MYFNPDPFMIEYRKEISVFLLNLHARLRFGWLMIRLVSRKVFYSAVQLSRLSQVACSVIIREIHLFDQLRVPCICLEIQEEK